MNHKATLIGLGIMGQRMLGSMHRYPGFDAVVAWDPDAAARAKTAALYPDVRIARDAADAIADPATTVVYIASPPRFHKPLALDAFAAGKAVYCEKPLGVDVDESRDLVARAEASGRVNIVNFSLASAAATRAVEQRLADGALGDVNGVDVRIHFSQWPREWQIDAAAWLSYRDEGGFTREVLSHWVYLSERLFGRARLDSAWARYPGGELAETHLHAALTAGDRPVSIAASSGGAGPDLVEYTIWGTRSSCRVLDWNRLFTSNGGEWRPELAHLEDPRETGYALQLANAAAAVAGEPHSMPSFADALSVQTLIEAMLA